ncbi:Glutamate receptor 1 [Amphibalanus amphitrite]|uniref:Glutamate receptor 1 n=1 Tax=Amphibalanus amphitrite TaxID=1232801 RepID=A0A6A4WIX5_AMPAM|nr:Glutamate receptor 1 [Amphibalanus amphitrite]
MEEPTSSLVSVGRGWPRDLLEREVRVATLHDPPHLFVERRADGSFSHGGFLFELWTILAARLGLRYRFVPMVNGSFGSLTTNGTWAGLVGELTYGRADLALTWLFRSGDRLEVIDFVSSAPIDSFQTGLFVRRGAPGAAGLSLSALTRPLGADVWWTLLAAIVALSAALRLTLVVSSRSAEQRRTVSELGWGSCLLASYMAMVGQGWARTPHSLAGRAITVCCWTLGLLVYSSYTATLVSHLASPTSRAPITSLSEFFAQPGWRLATRPGTSAENHWKTSSSHNERQLYHLIHDGEYIRIKDEGNEKSYLLQPKVMISCDQKSLYRMFGQHACEFQMLSPDTMLNKGSGYLPIAKGQIDLKEGIEAELQKLNEAGILGRLRNKWVEIDTNVCAPSQQYRPLSFANTLAVLAIVPLAVLVSGCMLAAETVVERAQLWGRWRLPLLWRVSTRTAPSRQLSAAEGAPVTGELPDQWLQLPDQRLQLPDQLPDQRSELRRRRRWLSELRTQLAEMSGGERQRLRAAIDATFDD